MDEIEYGATVAAQEEWEIDAARARLERLSMKTDGCWLFTGHIDAIGYGRIPALGENKAHRVSWVVYRGPIPAGMKVLHRCDVRNCVNPDHLFIGTQADNVADMMKKGRHKTVPLHGERNPMAKLTKDQAESIRQMVRDGARQIEACRRYGVSPMTVSRIVRGEAWK